MAGYDSPWKEVVEHHLEAVPRFLFPKVAEQVDWSQDHPSLEQELRKLAPEGPSGNRLADKLIRVQSISGDERYLHLEVQAQPEPDFERRIFVYHYRSDDRFGLPVDSLVVLADDDPHWRPTTYEVQLARTHLVFTFTPVKLLDWAEQMETLAGHDNPVALFVLAHLQSRQTRKDPQERARVKLGLILNLLERKLQAEEMRQWYRYLDWLLDLPREYERQVWHEVGKYSQEKAMPFVTFAERYGMEKGLEQGLEKGLEQGLEKGLEQGLEKGREEGLRKGIEAVLEIKFGADGLALVPLLHQVEDSARLEQLLDASKRASRPDEVRALLPPADLAAGGPTS